MRLLGILRMAARNIRHYARLSIGAALAIAMGFVSLTLFECYMVDARAFLTTLWGERFMYGDVLVETSAGVALSESDQDFIDGFLQSMGDEVEAHARFLDGSGMISQGATTAVFLAKGYEPAGAAALRGPRWAWDTVAGMPLQQTSAADSVLLGRGLAKLMGCVIEPTRDVLNEYGYPARVRPFACPEVPMQLRAKTGTAGISNLVARVTGVVNGGFRELDSRLVVLPLPFAQKLLGTTAVSYYAVRLRQGPVGAAAFTAALAAAAAARHVAVHGVPWTEHRDGDLFRRIFGFMHIIRAYIMVIMLAVVGLTVFMTFLKLVNERSGEIGTLRAVGFHDGAVVGFFAAEALILAASGVAAGAGFAAAATAILNGLALPYQVLGLTDPVSFHVSYHIESYVQSAAFVTAVSVASAVTAIAAKIRVPVADNFNLS